MSATTEYTGGCHCGAVRFRVQVERRVADDCNCSICAMKGFVHVIVPAERFTLERGEGAQREYRFGTGVARHLFCATCGICSHYIPRSHPEGVSVNLRCLDGDVSDFEIRPFDGQNWEQNVDSIR